MQLNNSSILIHVPNQEGGKPLMKTRNNIIKRIVILWLKAGLWREGSIGLHDDVIKLKHFPRYWPFVRGIHRPLATLWIPLTKASDADLLCFLRSAPE